jgi:hypothetical protein
MTKLRLPAPATVISLAALFISLSGVGYAAGVLPRGSVGTVQLRDNAVVSAKVRNGSLLATDFAQDQLQPGPEGPAGPAGPPGEPATKLWAVVNANGKLLRTSHATAVTVKSGSPYLVKFDQDVSACAVIATPGPPNPQVVATAFATNLGVEVHLAKRATGAVARDGFSVAVFC